MAFSYTNINTTPENLGDNNLLYIKAYDVPGRGAVVQTYIEKPFLVQVPLATNPVTYKTEQVNPILSEQSFFAPSVLVSDLSALVVDPAPSDFIPWTTLLTEQLPKSQKRITRAVTIPQKGSMVQVYSRTEYMENKKPKLAISPERLYWVDGIAVSGSDLVLGSSGTSPHYAEIWMSGNAVATPLSGISNWAQYVRFSYNGESRGAIPDHTSDNITVARDGVYLVTIAGRFSGGASSVYEIGLSKNGFSTLIQNVHGGRAFGLAGERSICLTGYVSFSALDALEVWIRQTSGILFNPTIEDMTLTVLEIL